MPARAASAKYATFLFLLLAAQSSSSFASPTLALIYIGILMAWRLMEFV